MFKMLEKPPFTRWKFVQRLVHRHRMSKRTGADKYKTFKVQGSSVETHEHDSLNDNQSEQLIQKKCAKESPFYTKRKLDKANETIGISEGITKVDLENSPGPIRRCRSAESLGRILDDSEEEIDTTEYGTKATNSSADVIETEEQQLGNYLTSAQQTNSKKEHNPISFRRTSKLRSSLREFKQRSKSHLDNARESMRRKVTSRKYDDLEPAISKDEDDEIVNYDRSPGLKRRQVIEI